jgi:hypothetical protein
VREYEAATEADPGNAKAHYQLAASPEDAEWPEREIERLHGLG